MYFHAPEEYKDIVTKSYQDHFDLLSEDTLMKSSKISWNLRKLLNGSVSHKYLIFNPAKVSSQ